VGRGTLILYLISAVNGWVSRLEDEMERERETTKEHINKDAIFYFKQRQ
jgi:hypothetical protein